MLVVAQSLSSPPRLSVMGTVSLPAVMVLPLPSSMAPLATLISLAAIALLFAANLHWEMLRGLVASYDVVPVGADFNARLALKQIADDAKSARLDELQTLLFAQQRAFNKSCER